MTKRFAGILAAAAIVTAATSAFAQSLYEHDHPWVVDFDGVDRPLYGCWTLASVTHPSTVKYIGDVEEVRSSLFGVREFRLEGRVTAPDGTLWTRTVLILEDQEAFVAMRLDTSTEPHHWYAIAILDDAGNATAAFPETEAQFTGEDPDADLATYERVSCADR